MTVIDIPRPLARRVTAPKGTASLPVVEVPKASIQKARKPVRIRRGSKKRAASDCSLGNFSDTITFSAWAFYHAAKKTEFASSFTPAELDHRALSFADDFRNLFIFNGNNLRRQDRSVFAVEDFWTSALAGRFAEGTAHLLMVKLGYKYWDRMASLWERAAHRAKISHDEMVRRARVIASKTKTGRPELEPDFACETAAGVVALMESKGSFVHPKTDHLSVKADLKHALDQLAEWGKWVTPTPKKSYGIGTYFRDRSDTFPDPSLIAFVDPPNTGDDDTVPVEFSPDWIRRGNYGAWLIGMGLPSAGDALRRAADYAPSEIFLPVARIAGRQFVVMPQRIAAEDDRAVFGSLMPPLWMLPRHWRLIAATRMLSRYGLSGIEVLGIDTEVLRVIERALVSPTSPVLLKLDSQKGETDEEPPEQQPPSKIGAEAGFDGSIMPDGTLVGLLTEKEIDTVTEEAFAL